jgi:hypothetical protein
LLRDIIESNPIRDAIEIMALDSIDGKEYKEWTAGDIQVGFFRQYISHLSADRASSLNYAWYNTPIYSDTTTVNFIKLPRYKTDSNSTYKEKLLPLFAEVIEQELWRMNFVAERKDAGAAEI